MTYCFQNAFELLKIKFNFTAKQASRLRSSVFESTKTRPKRFGPPLAPSSEASLSSESLHNVFFQDETHATLCLGCCNRKDKSTVVESTDYYTSLYASDIRVFKDWNRNIRI
jgi:hypothetical protein